MLDDDVRIRAAIPEEAEALSEIAWRSKESWGYPLELLNEFRDFLTLTPEFLENNYSYLIEDGDSGEILGFYTLERKVSGEWWLRHHIVVPERVGSDIGQLLFLNACEIAETAGARKLNILSDPNSEDFYLRMGAERVGAGTLRCCETGRELPVLEIKLR